MSVDDDMKLPEGKTCGDCRHIKRCTALFGVKATNTFCDFAPSCFSDAMLRASKGER